MPLQPEDRRMKTILVKIGFNVFVNAKKTSFYKDLP